MGPQHLSPPKDPPGHQSPTAILLQGQWWAAVTAGDAWPVHTPVLRACSRRGLGFISCVCPVRRPQRTPALVLQTNSITFSLVPVQPSLWEGGCEPSPSLGWHWSGRRQLCSVRSFHLDHFGWGEGLWATQALGTAAVITTRTRNARHRCWAGHELGPPNS